MAMPLLPTPLRRAGGGHFAIYGQALLTRRQPAFTGGMIF